MFPCKRLTMALVWVALACATAPVTAAQTAVMHDGSPALKFHATFYYEGNVAFYVDRVYEGEPKFKFLAKKNDTCFGLMYISRSGVFYSGGSDCPTARFDYRREQIIGFTPNEVGFIMALPSGKAAFNLDWRAATEGGAEEQAAAARFVALAYQNFDAAEQQFKQLIAPLRANLKPPVISIFEPSDVQEGKVLRVSGDSTRLRGTVTSQSGIVKMEANGNPATLRQLSSQVYEFDIRLPLTSVGVNPVVISAVAGDTSEAQIAFAVNRAAVEILEPVGKPEGPALTLKVRGIARGFSDVQRVEIAGLPATLNRRDDGIEFVLAQVPLKLGDNVLDGAVVTGDGARQPFQVLAKRLPPPGPPPLTLKEVEDALSGMPKARVIELVKKYGVDFDLSDANEQQLRSAGATPELLLVVAKAKR